MTFESFSFVCQIVNVHHNARAKYEKLSTGIESLVEVQMFLHFLKEGKLPKIESLSPCDDEEYIGSALSLGQDLTKYCANRALKVSASLFFVSFSLRMIRNLFYFASRSLTP